MCLYLSVLVFVHECVHVCVLMYMRLCVWVPFSLFLS